MNSKDLCAIELIPEIVNAGVCSLKIEGRTKSAYYTAITSRAYRRALDDHLAGRPFDQENLRDLMRLSNRTYTSGFYSRNPRQYGENREDGYSAALGEPVCGVIQNYDPDTGIAEIEVKNRFLPAEELTLITPTKDITFTLEAILDQHGKKLEAAHGGARNVWVKFT